MRGSVGIDQFFRDVDFATLAQFLIVAANGLHDRFAAVRIRIADIELQDDAAGDAVDCAGVDRAGADGGYGVDRSGGESMFFDGENKFGGRTERVFAIGHQERSGVAAKTRDGEPVARRGGYAGYDAERDALMLEQGALFDVKLNPRVIVIRQQAHGGEWTHKACRGADGAER